MQTLSISPRVLSVSELNHSVAQLLEQSIPLCWISGEVSNFTRAQSGHWYFTLKDDAAQVRAVMFKNRTMAIDFVPREGDKIEVRATVSLYVPRGDYQLNVESIRRAGLGNLYEAFVKLKQTLSAQGLFDSTRKKPLPTFPKCLGIVTSQEAAALRDILTTLKRRAPHVAIIIYPTPVQGAGSAEKITQAIKTASERNECDVLLIARGGGSIEDLWSFNDEQLAYAISECPIPTISGVGHETDFTIADFVADVRAPTPTAAAEIAVTARSEWIERITHQVTHLRRALRRLIDQHTQTLDRLCHRLISPLAAIHNQRLKLAALGDKMRHTMFSAIQQCNFQYRQLKQRFIQLKPTTQHEHDQLQRLAQQMQRVLHGQLLLQKQHVGNLAVQLELLNPQRTLERGYSIITDKRGMILRSPHQFHAPDIIHVRLADGEVDLELASVQ